MVFKHFAIILLSVVTISSQSAHAILSSYSFANDFDSIFSINLSENNIPEEFEEDLPKIKAMEILKIKNLTDFPKINSKDQSFYSIANNRSNSFILSVENKTPKVDFRMRRGIRPRHHRRNLDKRRKPIYAKLSCDAPFTAKFNLGKNKKRVTEIQFTIQNNIRLVFSNDVTNCTLLLKEKSNKVYTNKIKLISESKLYPYVHSMGDRVSKICRYNPDNSNNPNNKEKTTENYFANSTFKTMGCVTKSNSAEFINTPSEKGLQKRIEILTGSPLPEYVLEDKNLDYKINFSNAPEFDAIFISSLMFKNDFTGGILVKALKHHALNGTMIRIIVPEGPIFVPFIESKDRALLKELTDMSGHAKVQYIKYHKTNILNVSQFHRSIHSKIFLTYSKNRPVNNWLIIGGKNLQDTYFFEQAPNYSKFPSMTQYQSEVPFIHYTDMEIVINSASLSKEVGEQFMSLWHRSYNSMKMRPTFLHRPTRPQIKFKALEKEFSRNTYIRHFLSVPYVDGKELNNIFVQLIDTAKKTIKITTPYFRLNWKLTAAFKRAIKRNVKIELVTRFSFARDNVPKVAEDINKRSVNKFYKNTDIYIWTKNSIIHSKTLLIDEKLLFVGSVNFNMRSFKHDIENGIFLTGKKLITQYLEIFNNSYINPANSKKVEKYSHIGLFNRFLIRLFGSLF